LDIFCKDLGKPSVGDIRERNMEYIEKTCGIHPETTYVIHSEKTYGNLVMMIW